MKCFIVTGTSRGLGGALAAQLLGPEHRLFCISRKENPKLTALAGEKAADMTFIPYDLSEPDGIESMMDSIFSSIKGQDIEGYYLINNAGVVEPVKPAERCPGPQIAANFQVNAIAPAILVASFIRLTRDFPVDKRILNISSGAGRKPYYGWSAYCSAKSALDMFTRCIALEQEQRPHPVKILSFAPGIIDTEMQQRIRESNREDFIQLDRFIEFKTAGKLKSADYVADKAIRLLFDDQVPSGSLLDIASYG